MMSDRFSLEELEWSVVLGCIILAIILLLVNGCAVPVEVDIPVTGVDLTRETTASASGAGSTATGTGATATGKGSTAISITGVCSWCLTGLAGALWGWSGWKRRTAVKALERVTSVIDLTHKQEREGEIDPSKIVKTAEIKKHRVAVIKAVKRCVGTRGDREQNWVNRLLHPNKLTLDIDAAERLIRKVLKRMK